MKRLITILLVLISASCFAPNLISNYHELVEFFQAKAKHERILGLMEAIKYVESRGDYDAIGKLGEIGAYQFMQATWKHYQLKYFGKVNEPTKEIQDMTCYLAIQDFVNKGYSNRQIASFWNSGKAKSQNKKVHRYVKKVMERVK